MLKLKQIQKYDIKRSKSTTDKKKNYYLEGMKIFLRNGETPENYLTVLEEIHTAFLNKKDAIDNLFDEIKTIKKLKKSL